MDVDIDRYFNSVNQLWAVVSKSSESIAAGWKLCKSHLQACGVSHFYFKLRALGLGCGLTCFPINFFPFFFFFLGCVWAADFLRSCIQGWWWPILPSWALEFGKKKLKVRNWADMCILVVHRLKGNCIINLLLSCLWSLLLQPEHDPPFHVLFPPLLNLKPFHCFHLAFCLAISWALTVMSSAS